MRSIETKIREYGEENPVHIQRYEPGDEFYNLTNGRWMINASNEAGFNCTSVDLADVIEWVKQNMPELLK